MSKKNYAGLQRLKAIEVLAYWEGRLITNQLANLFGISRQRASADIKNYLENHNPNALKHDPRVKAYVPIEGFSLVLTTGHINEYMDLIAGLSCEKMALAIETDVNVVGLQLPNRSVRPEVTRKVVNACRNRTSLKIRYASMGNPAPHDRIISPHTIVSTGFRWHVRAYCHTRQSYRDFILSRINGIPLTVDVVAPSIKEDNDWNEMIAINIIPNTLLSDAHKKLIEKDYGMSDGRLQLNIRKALAHYSLQRYQAAITEDDIRNVQQYPIQLEQTDREKLNPYLFGGKK
ncbi:WYL domain-containing protein [Oceanobacter sp. 5_MG-2023]|uniref:WYL domain-containing protein n=1 Tax=Oceanobacter sp. 5_MG-2023 TaxID=3062645 RepID=UPI0026E490EA|nr:WYL domain-containing protein [Oceanobacter sp. 5_MG-2023]MDO6683746.1 WYL domain-containing protein [Oceanobacter sp. 5_MG-2023]